MKKIIILLTLLVLISGCVDLQTETQDSGPDVELGEGASDIDQQGTPSKNTFTISEGSFITYNKKKILVKELNFRNEMTLSVDGKELIFYQTKTKEIFQDLEITPLEFHLDPEGEDTNVVLEINKLSLEPNQYLLYKDQEAVTNKGKVVLKDVIGDKMNAIMVRVSNEQGGIEERINKGDTEEILGVTITNVYPRARAIGYEKYAIIGVI